MVSVTLAESDQMMSLLRWVMWIGSGVITLLLLAQPISVETQQMLSYAVILAMIVMWRWGKGGAARQVCLALGTLVIIRYMYWRLTSTLPPLNDPANFVPGVILVIGELYCVLIMVISLVISADPIHRPPLEREEDDKLPTVDVFIPTYNEDELILATTMAAARSMDYPVEKLTIWLLDDGGSDQKCNQADPKKAQEARNRKRDLMALCEQMGARYHTRQRNEHAKAGNMNDALKYATGDLIVVFDADHAPFRSFLRETVGHFALDEKLFLVQTPHVFLNPDPIEKNLRTFDRMPSENEMFYSVTQCGLDKWDASFFCGSAAVLRRKALDTTGGFSGVTITEDCETAFELHANGWHSVFVEKPLIAGLQPETFVSFIGQRSRWCQGMFQILMLKNPALKKGLSVTQKICYMSSMTFWFFPLPRLIFMTAPLLYIFFDVKIFVSNIDETYAYTLSYIIINLMMQNYLYGRVRWPWMSELYEYVQGVFLSKAMISVAMNPRKPTFNVTAKGLTLDNDHLSELSWPFFVIYGVLFAGGLMATWRYFFEPGVNSLMIVVGAWNTFNMMIAGAALGAVAERSQPDRNPRLGIDREGVLTIGATSVPVKIENVSAGGCFVRAAEKMSFSGSQGEVKIGQLTITPMGDIIRDECLMVQVRRIAADDKTTGFALEFSGLDPAQYFVLADLMYGDSDALPRFLASRRQHRDIFTGTGQFLYWGLTEPARAFAYMFKKKPVEEAAPQVQASAPGVAPAAAPKAVPSPATAGLWDIIGLAKGPSGSAASAVLLPQVQSDTKTA